MTIPYSRQDIIKKDIDAVIKVLKSDFLTQGPQVPNFEKAVCKYTEAKYGVAVNSATSALHIACLALGVKAGDRVWTSPNTFVASANCAIYCGAKIDFVDIDPDTYNLSINELKKKLEAAKKKKLLPKVVIPVHFAGQPCEMHQIYKLSKKYNFKIIEDASHAPGSAYLRNENLKKKNFIKVGSSKYSDITIFSFHPVKIITTAEGGIALTNNKFLSDRMRLLRAHGITREKKKLRNQSSAEWYYEQIELGFNYRMNDIQAALGIEQLKRIDKFVLKRNILAKRYNRLLKNIAVKTPQLFSNIISSFHLYVINLNEKFDKKQHMKLFKLMRKKGIGVNLHYIPVHTHPYYLKMGFKKGDFPNSEKFYEKAISLPLYPNLKKKDQDFIINILRKNVRQ
jgi:UDP-4-amino-4,6-dideoxy-N-acetyl-beta-L-altrosamine transaminase